MPISPPPVPKTLLCEKIPVGKIVLFPPTIFIVLDSIDISPAAPFPSIAPATLELVIEPPFSIESWSVEICTFPPSVALTVLVLIFQPGRI